MDMKSIDGPTAVAGCGTLAQAPPRVADPYTIVMFGASGDLAKRRLVPALYNLRGDGLLGDAFAIVGVGRDALTGEHEFAPQPNDPERTNWLAASASYVTGGYEDEATCRRLLATLTGRGASPANVLFYLATDADALLGASNVQDHCRCLRDERAGGGDRVGRRRRGAASGVRVQGKIHPVHRSARLLAEQRRPRRYRHDLRSSRCFRRFRSAWS